MNAPGGAWWASQRENHTPPPARGAGSRRPFGTTWWGGAWISALESRAELDPNRLPRGRSYARRGTVEELQITRGLVLAQVQGSRETPYSVTVAVRVFTGDQWDRLLDVIAGRLGHTAALLDGELPPEVSDDAAEAGLDLLPGPGDLTPRCSCPDVADPCKHSSAVCYIIADALDEDPFVLFQLRGHTRGDVLEELRSRRTAVGGFGSVPPGVGPRSPSDAGIDAGIDAGLVARAAFAGARAGLPEIPVPPLPPLRPSAPASLAADPPAESGATADQLNQLAPGAVRRVWELATGGSEALAVSWEEDLARWAAELLDTPGFTALARRAGVPARELTGWALAWRAGGRDGVRAMREVWTPDADIIAEGKAVLTAETGHPARARGNRVTSGDRQLRLGSDGLWYSFTKSSGGWELVGPPSPEPQGMARRDTT